MNLDYKDSLRDLGLTEEQIESILDLNSEYLSEALSEAWYGFYKLRGLFTNART